MSERNARLLLEDIIEAINNIQQYTADIRSYAEFIENGMVSQAVYFNFTVIGEAVSQIPTAYKNQHPALDWRIIQDIRNVIIHEYFGIKPQIIWDTIQFEVPDLKIQIQNLLNDYSHE